MADAELEEVSVWSSRNGCQSNAQTGKQIRRARLAQLQQQGGSRGGAGPSQGGNQEEQQK